MEQPGAVYVLVNPAWPDWVKVGHVLGVRKGSSRALDSRLSNYNVSDPHNGFSYAATERAACAVQAEAFAHDLISVHHERGTGEWFKCPVETARALVECACGIARIHPDKRKTVLAMALQEEKFRMNDETQQILREIAEEKPSKGADIAATARAAHQIIDVLVDEWQKARDYETTEDDKKIEIAAATIQRRLVALGGVA